MRIFISYSRDDKNYVYEFADALREETRHDVWIDQMLVGASRWWGTILSEVEACDCFITILTPHCINSIYCTAELNYALALNKPVLPLMLKPCEEMMPAALQPIQYIDIERVSLEKAVTRAIVALGKVELAIERGQHPPAQNPPTRPPVPEPKANATQHSYEIFVAAEEAAAANQFALAEQLFEQIIKADPKGIGGAAAERLSEIRLEREMDIAYANVEKLAANPATLKGARAAWRAFVTQYGEIMPVPDSIADSKIVQKAPQRPKIDFSKVVREVIGEPFEWIEIPGGKVRLEDTSDYNPPSTKWRNYIVLSFAIAKYPVTNKQYQAFVEAKDGYANEKWWRYSIEAKQWRATNPRPKDTAFEGDDLPRTNVNWYETVAFCFWLEYQILQSKQKIMLPTGQEWQRAAIGDTGQVFTWGNEFDKNKCNFDSESPTPVTQYINGISPYGVMDMSGNVWEWCMTIWGTDSIDMTGDNARLIRGGSWGSIDQSVLRARHQSSRSSPDIRSQYGGFRLASFL